MVQYDLISIKEVLSRVLRHPMLRDVTLEEAVQYVVDFLHALNVGNIFQDREAVVNIDAFRGILPCDLIRVTQVKDLKSGLCLRYMTNSFYSSGVDESLTYKTQGKVIYTSFPKGSVLVAYKAIPVDEEGFPLVHDNPRLLGAVEAYIKKKVFTILFDMGKINQNVLQNCQQEYAWLVGQCQSEYTMPSIDEMESIKNEMTTLIQKTHDHRLGFRQLGDEQIYKRH